MALSSLPYAISQAATDPSRLERVDVVITSYQIVASEHATYSEDAKDESKSKGKKSKKGEDDDDSDESDSDDIRFVRKPVSKKKDALFRVKWWRVVLGTSTLLCVACADYTQP